MSRAQKLFEQSLAAEKEKEISVNAQLNQAMDLVYEEMNQQSLAGYYEWCLSSYSLRNKGVKNLNSFALSQIVNRLREEGFEVEGQNNHLDRIYKVSWKNQPVDL